MSNQRTYEPEVEGYLGNLAQLVEEHFDERELALLCQELGFDLAELPAGEIGGYAGALIQVLHRRDRLGDLLYECQRRRPKVAWPTIPEAVRRAGLAPDELLAELPTETIPEPADRRADWSLIFKCNRLFTGREDMLKILAQSLKEGQTVAVTGMAGVGKSQLAVEFAYRYGRYFVGGVHWLSFADPGAIPTEVIKCGRNLGLGTFFDELGLDGQVELVRQVWKEPTPRLLVFDNCEEEALLDDWRPFGGGARVLVTSRKAAWDPLLGVYSVELDELSRPQSIDLLQKFSPSLDQVTANGIAEELGDLPLALHVAGSFLRNYGRRWTPESYLDRLREGYRLPGLLTETARPWRGADFRPTGRELNVAKAFSLSYEQLDPAGEVDELALALLGRMACFAPGEPVSWDLLQATVGLASRPLPEGHISRISLMRFAISWDEPMPWQVLQGELEQDDVLLQEDALYRLEELGLVNVNGTGAQDGTTTVTMHRLLVAYVQARMTDTALGCEAQAAVEETLLNVSGFANEQRAPAPLLIWRAHLRHVTDMAVLRCGERAVSLCNALGNHLREMGDYKGALPYFQEAVRIRQETLGPEDAATAASLNRLSSLLYTLGQYDEARQHSEHAVAIAEKVYGPDHLETAYCLHNLAAILDILDEQEEGRNTLERVLGIFEKELDPDAEEISTMLNNLGVLSKNMGDYEEAMTYYERALAIREKAFGPNSSETAEVLNNMGSLLAKQGDNEAALSYHERALTIRRKALPENHPNLGVSLFYLGRLLDHMGDLEQAHSAIQEALAIFESSLPADHHYIELASGGMEAIEEKMGR